MNVPEDVFECGRVCASSMSDLELASSFVALLVMVWLMVLWDTRPVCWLRVRAGKVLDYWGA